MNHYYVANEKAQFDDAVNYSFAVGDINGDGKMEFLGLNRRGDMLTAIDLQGNILFRQPLKMRGLIVLH